MDLVPIKEEKLGGQALDLLGLKAESETQGDAILKAMDDTPTEEKSSKHCICSNLKGDFKGQYCNIASPGAYRIQA